MKLTKNMLEKFKILKHLYQIKYF